jgi:hypothetical protein
MDTFARGLLIASRIRFDGVLEKMLTERYASWDQGIGREIEQGWHSLVGKPICSTREKPPLMRAAARLLENILNRYINRGIVAIPRRSWAQPLRRSIRQREFAGTIWPPNNLRVLGFSDVPNSGNVRPIEIQMKRKRCDLGAPEAVQ